MSSADVRDMMDLPALTAGHPRPAKKQKTVEKRPDGISRELYSLMGDNAAGVQLREPLKYKEKPKLSKRPRTWDMTPFTNPARSDGLVLRHWKMTSENVPDEIKKKGPIERPAPAVEEDYPFEKYNIQVQVPEYTDEQYEKHLKNDDWTREETEYLMSLCREYNLRWIIIADRYSFEPAAQASNSANGDNSLIPVPKERAMEDLKARYYTIAAKCLAIARPPASMTTSEFELYEKMLKFDPVRETTRKTIADSLMRRTVEEVKEEEFLLGELKDIVEREDRLLNERRELYARLDAPQSTGNVSQYHSSAGIGQVMQTLLNADKNKKRKSLLPGETGGLSSPANVHPNAPHLPARPDHDAAAPPPKQKQTSVSHPLAPKQLSAADEAKYGLSHPPDRITSGVQFRSDRATKLTQAKSQVQTAKIQAALAELGLPLRLTMPTEKVVGMFERLIANLQTLLEVRKVSEKTESEIRVIQGTIAERERKAQEREAADKGQGANKVTGGGGEDVVMTNGDERIDQGTEEQGNEGNGDVKMEDNETHTQTLDGAVDAVTEGEAREVEEGTTGVDQEDGGHRKAEDGDAEVDAAGDEVKQLETGDNDPDVGAEAEEHESKAANDEEQESQQIDGQESDGVEGEEDDEEAEGETEPHEEIEVSDAPVEENAVDMSNADDQESLPEEGSEQGENEEDADGDGGNQDEKPEEPALDPDKGPVAAATRQHKRSASVLSGGSRGSVKRSRK